MHRPRRSRRAALRGKSRARAVRTRSPGFFVALRALAELRAVRIGLGAALTYVVVLNAIVRYVGHGDAFLLSVFHLRDKTYAVGALALHSVTHVWSAHDGDAREIVAQAAREHDVPVPLALAIARTESGLRPHCISATGAMGMMQLMPGTALAHSVFDPFDPAQNAAGGSSYLHELSLRYHGDRERIAAAYNAGAGRVPRSGPLLGLPSETRTYISRVVQARGVTPQLD